jgi:hypothetical protein
MRRLITSQAWRLSIALILAFTLLPLTAGAQEPDPPGPQVEEAGSAEMGPPTYVELEWTDELPTLTEEQKANLAYWAERSHLTGPALDQEAAVAPAGPTAGTESVLAETRTRSGQPLAPSDPKWFRRTCFGAVIPDTDGANNMSSSVAISGKFGFFTGNRFAARSTDGGLSWSYVNPFADFADFCCDQISIYDEARDIFLWLRTGTPDGNGENEFKLAVSKKEATGWWSYTRKPEDIDSAWQNQRWANPHIQLGADYAYIAWNLFDQSDNWTRSVMLRVPLDDLAAGTAFTYNYHASDEWFTFVPVQGAYHTMYWASNWPNSGSQNNRLRIWRWDEDSTSVSVWTKTIHTWNLTEMGDAQCGRETGNWAARADQRLLTGARYSINSDGSVDDRIRGRKVLGWWWNVAQGGGFTHPYIDAAAFFEDTMDQVPGYLGRPYMYSSELCFGYPSATPNKRQDLGMVVNWAEANAFVPNIGYSIADDYVQAPPSWFVYKAKRSQGRPRDLMWGDYNTVREFEPTQKVWVAGAHRIPTPGSCTDCAEPCYFAFGRERDFWSYARWRGR